MQYLYCTLDTGHCFDDTLATHTNMQRIINRLFRMYFYTISCHLFCSASWFIFTVPYCVPFSPSSSYSSSVSHDVLVALLILCRVILFMFDADGFVSSKTFFRQFTWSVAQQFFYLCLSLSLFSFRLVCLANSFFVDCVANFALNLMHQCIFRNVSLCVLCTTINFFHRVFHSIRNCWINAQAFYAHRFKL